MFSKLIDILSSPLLKMFVNVLLSIDGDLYVLVTTHFLLFILISSTIVSIGSSNSRSGLRLAGMFPRTFTVKPPPAEFLSLRNAL